LDPLRLPGATFVVPRSLEKELVAPTDRSDERHISQPGLPSTSMLRWREVALLRIVEPVVLKRSILL